MNFDELKEIVVHLKKIVPCSHCKKHFGNDGINVLSSYGNEALFHFTCFNCVNQLLIHVSIVEDNEKESKLSIQTRNAPNISENDVLDIHNFLNQFNGDFKELFSETR